MTVIRLLSIRPSSSSERKKTRSIEPKQIPNSTSTQLSNDLACRQDRSDHGEQTFDHSGTDNFCDQFRMSMTCDFIRRSCNLSEVRHDDAVVRGTAEFELADDQAVRIAAHADGDSGRGGSGCGGTRTWWLNLPGPRSTTWTGHWRRKDRRLWTVWRRGWGVLGIDEPL